MKYQLLVKNINYGLLSSWYTLRLQERAHNIRVLLSLHDGQFPTVDHWSTELFQERIKDEKLLKAILTEWLVFTRLQAKADQLAAEIDQFVLEYGDNEKATD